MGITSHADSQAKVTEVDVEVGVYHDVFRLYVSVDDAAVVTSSDGPHQLRKDEMSLVLSQMPRFPSHHELVKVATRDEWRYHDDLVLSDDGLRQRQDA